MSEDGSEPENSLEINVKETEKQGEIIRKALRGNGLAQVVEKLGEVFGWLCEEA